jgi:predicted dehydrogenase
MTIRIGIIGAAYGTQIHAPGFLSEGLDVVALCAEDRERAESEAARLGIPAVFTDYTELLARPGLDAVSITGPQGPHHELAMAALRAGKHVICEKPFALNAREGKEMADLAEHTGLTAMVAHEFRFTSGRARVKELIDDGYIGDPKFALVRLLRGPTQHPSGGPAEYVEENDSAAAGGGFLFRMGSHYVDALRHWFGEVTEVEGRLLTTSPERVRNAQVRLADSDDTFFFTLRFESGVVAEMVGARAAPFASEFSITFFGSQGILVTPQKSINPPSHGVVCGARLGTDQPLAPLPIPERLEPFQDERDDRLFPFRLFVREFVRGVEQGISPHPNFVDGFRCMQVLDAVRQSSATGQRVLLSR